MGTPDYVAPEQALDAHAADARADLYSLGCTLYQLLAGRVPFPGGGVLEKLESHVNRQPTPLGKLRPDLPPGLAEVVAKLMARNPADRYQTPAEVAAALAQFTGRRRKRSPLAALLAIAGSAALCLLAVAAWAALSPKPPVPPEKDPPGALVEEEVAFPVPTPAEFAARSSPADDLKREDLSPEALASVGYGDPARTPAELVAVFGSPRWRVAGWVGYPGWRADGKLLAVPSGSEVRIFDPDGRLIRRLVGHTSTVITARFSPDGKLVATAGQDRTVRLWEADTGRTRFCRAGFSTYAWGVAISPDGSTLAASGGDSFRVWDTRTGEQRIEWRSTFGNLWGVAYSTDSETVAVGCSDGRVLRWSVKDGAPLPALAHQSSRPKGDGHLLVAFSPDGRSVATGSDELVRVWDVTQAQPRSLWEKDRPAAGLLAFAPDSASLWTAPHWAGNLPAESRAATRSNVRTGEAEARLPFPSQGNLLCLSLSPDGKTIAGSDAYFDSYVRLTDTATGEVHNPPTGHASRLAQVVFSPDGKALASAGIDRLVRTWDLSTGKERLCLAGHTATLLAIAYSPDGRMLASGSEDKSARLWDARTGALIDTLPHAGNVESVTFSPDNQRLVTGCSDHKVRIWDVASRALLHTLEGHTGAVRGLCFDRSGRRLATASHDSMVHVWDLETRSLERVLRGHRSFVYGVAGMPDNRQVASTGDDATVRLWSWQVREPSAVVFRAGAACRCVAPSPDGRLLAVCGLDGNLHLHDRTATPPRRRTWRLFGSGNYWFHWVAFSPEGRYLATANPDGTVYLLRLAQHGKVPQVPEVPDTMIEERSFDGHVHAWVNNLALSADGAVAWTAGHDKTLRAWRVADAHQVCELRHPTSVQHVALSPTANPPSAPRSMGRCAAGSLTEPASRRCGRDRSASSPDWPGLQMGESWCLAGTIQPSAPGRPPLARRCPCCGVTPAASNSWRSTRTINWCYRPIRTGKSCSGI